jgi:hypothetical protein
MNLQDQHVEQETSLQHVEQETSLQLAVLVTSLRRSLQLVVVLVVLEISSNQKF